MSLCSVFQVLKETEHSACQQRWDIPGDCRGLCNFVLDFHLSADIAHYLVACATAEPSEWTILPPSTAVQVGGFLLPLLISVNSKRCRFCELGLAAVVAA